MLKDYAIEINQIYAKRFGIGESTAITTVKPSGTIGIVAGASHGMHARFKEYYLRRIRISSMDPLYQLMRDEGYPCVPDNGEDPDNPRTLVLEFPVKAPEGSKLIEDVTAIQQLEFWKIVKVYYTEHNPSISVYYKQNEIEDVKKWILENWKYITGISFFPASDGSVYPLQPMEAITKEKYDEMCSAISKVNFARLTEYEKIDTTEVISTVACAGGNCEV